jgi:hypothetical protein
MAELQGDLGPFRAKETDLVDLCSDLEKSLAAADPSNQTKFELSVRRKERYSEQCSNIEDLKAFLVRTNALPIKVAHSFDLKITRGARSIELRGESSYADYHVKGAKDMLEAESYRTVLRNFISRHGSSRFLTDVMFIPLLLAPIPVFLLLRFSTYPNPSLWTIIQQNPLTQLVSFIVIACYLAFIAYSVWSYSLAAVNPEICFRHTIIYINAVPTRSFWAVVMEIFVAVIAGLIAWWLTGPH